MGLSPLKTLAKWALSDPDRAAFFVKYSTPFLNWYKKKRALKTFYEAWEKKDYRGLIRERAGIKDPPKIRTFEDFQERVPLMRKRDILALDLRRREVTEGYRITSSSGTSGRRLTIARFPEQDEFIPVIMRLGFERFLQARQKKIVVLNAFAMGRSFSGGVLFGKYITEMGEDLSTTVDDCGNEVEAILASLLDPLYKGADEFVLATYPPKAKEVVLEIRKRKIDLSSLPKINLLLSGQGFSEEERNFLAQGLKINADREGPGKIGGAYGLTETIEGGGQETIASIALKRGAWKNPELAEELFGNPKISKFGLYVTGSPAVLIEEVGGEVVFTVFDSDPKLVRYATGDLGHILLGKETLERARTFGFDLEEVLLKQGYSPKVVQREILFLSSSELILVKGRRDGIIVCGANIGRSLVEEALESADLKKYIQELILLDPFDEEGFEYPFVAILLKEGRVPKRFEEICREKIQEFLFLSLADYKAECLGAHKKGRFMVKVRLFRGYSDQEPSSPFSRKKVKMSISP